jgi:DNA-directed RNA polymerase subunit RPC12/RpoP
MALIKCEECGNDVSTEAKACPKCGAKIKYKKPTSRTTMIIGGLFAISMVAGIATSNNAAVEKQSAEAARKAAMTPEQKAAEDAAKAKRTTQIQRAGAGALALKKGMKDPTAFELTSLVLKPDGTACYEFRGKNSFGAVFPTAAVATSKGKLLTQERDKNAFVKAWNDGCTVTGGDDLTTLIKRNLLD